MNIYEAITAAMSDIEPIAKGRKNKDQNFMFRGIDEIMNDLQPILKKHGLFVVPEVLDMTREVKATKSGGSLLYSILKIRYTFYSQDGSSVSATVVGEGMDSSDKASNKAMAVGMKYALLQVFCIPTEDPKDPDAESHDILPPLKTTPKTAPKQIETVPLGNSAPPAPKSAEMETLAAVMKKTRADGTPYFTDDQKAGYKKQIAVYGLSETLKNAVIALEEMEAAQ